MRRSLIISLACLVLCFGACGTDDPIDNGMNQNQTQADAGGENPDAIGGDAGEEDADEFRAPNLYHSASAGGSIEGDGYRMVIGVGAPVPRGQAEGGGYRIQLGPVSP